MTALHVGVQPVGRLIDAETTAKGWMDRYRSIACLSCAKGYGEE